ncbi:hypothetical protein IWX90DRAFT_435997 [Phyllosticta citrichinensis]|uniref:Uncharacterized protein n=1 Tax=Phyllosticta citrichinensis TaxID=1130410 RepID=A0ABR1XR44_9PEZI
MFENFSFDAASRHASSFDVDDCDPYWPMLPMSPTSSPAPGFGFDFLSPRSDPTPSVEELSWRLARQNICSQPPPFCLDEQEWRRASSNASSTSSSPLTAEFPDVTSCPSPAHIRNRRQAHMQLQCESTHMRDIADLVKKMVEEGDQCVLTSRNDSIFSSASSTSSGDDVEPCDIPRKLSTPLVSQPLRYKRSGDTFRGSAVSKDIRFRKRALTPRKHLARKLSRE